MHIISEKEMHYLAGASRESTPEPRPAPLSARKSTYIRHTRIIGTPRSLSIPDDDDDDDDELENLFLLKKRVYPSVYRTMGMGVLPDEALRMVFEQMRHDHVDKGIYEGVMTPKEASALALIILTATRSPNAHYLKDTKFKADQIRKALPSCLPKSLLQ